ncbi:MAG: FAD:protein FMN transferase [Eubacteriaceae bacterium]
MKKIHLYLTILLILLSLVGCTPQNENRYEATFLDVFDTVTTVIAYSNSEETFTKQSQFIHDELKVYHQLFDIYNDYPNINNIKTINENAGNKPVVVDKKIIDLIEFSKAMYQETEGKVNIAFGSVLSLWHQYRSDGLLHPEAAKIPESELLQEAATHTDINKVIIDKENSTVFLEDSKMLLDLGAVAKGYAVEKVMEKVQTEMNFNRGLISAGGNVRTIGYKNSNNDPWSVGIQNPDLTSPDQTVATLNLTDESMVTSGAYQRFYTVNGINYHHIIDPLTLMPADYFSSVTIITPDSGVADALSTAVFNMPLDEGLAFIEKTDHTDAFWILKDGSTVSSSGI